MFQLKKKPGIRRIRIESSEEMHLADISEGTWAVSYSDLLMVLMSFFVIFYSADKPEDREQLFKNISAVISQNSPQKKGGSRDTIIALPGSSVSSQGHSQGTVAGGKSAGGSSGIGRGRSGETSGTWSGGGGGNAKPGGMTHIGAGAGTRTQGMQSGGMALSSKALGEEGEKDGTYPLSLVTSITNILKKHQSLRKYKLKQEELPLKLTIYFPDNIFKTGGFKITPSVALELDKVLAIIKPFSKDLEIHIVGHTDSKAFRGKHYYVGDNFALSALRASSALQYFAQKGIDPRSLYVAGGATNERESRTLSLKLIEKKE